MSEHVQLIEPAIVPDTFCSGLAEVEDLGDGNHRLTLYSRQKSVHDRSLECIVVARLVLSGGAVHTALKQISQALQPEGRSIQ